MGVGVRRVRQRRLCLRSRRSLGRRWMSWMRSRDGGCVLEEEMGLYTLHHSVGSFFFFSLARFVRSFVLARFSSLRFLSSAFFVLFVLCLSALYLIMLERHTRCSVFSGFAFDSLWGSARKNERDETKGRRVSRSSDPSLSTLICSLPIGMALVAAFDWAAWSAF